MGLTLDILICTIDEGIENIASILQEERSDVTYIVSHQITDHKFRQIPPPLKVRNDVVISHIKGRGLSANRNNALSLARGDIAVLADDDILYLTDTFHQVLNSFDENPDAEVICFKIKNMAFSGEYKPYPARPTRINKLGRYPISSIEIAFRVAAVRERQIRFDERFGLGSPVVIGGEEQVFIDTCLSRGLRVLYLPIYIVKHNGLGSIAKLPFHDIERAVTMSAVDAQICPIIAIPKAFGRTARYMPQMLSHKTNPVHFLFQSLKAIHYIWSTNKK
ncbi:MAG: glycosyltransferase [Syntrophales bacterium]|nr:glycosyltransferase [Syntrophales bacterium]